MFELKLIESDDPEESESEIRASFARTYEVCARVIIHASLWIYIWSLANP